MQLPDKHLVEQARSGDQQCFVELIRRHTPKVFPAAMAILNDVHDAEDVLQDAVVTAYRRVESLRKAESFGSWLLRIVVNRAKDVRRDRTRTIRMTESVEPPVEYNPDDELDLMAAIGELPERNKNVLVLFLSGLTTREVSEALDRPVGTVRRQLSEAYASLRDQLTPRGPAE